MAGTLQERIFRREIDAFGLSEANSLLDIAERHVVITGDADPMGVAAKYGLATQQTFGGYALQDAEEIGRYLDQVGKITTEARTQLEARILAEGPVFREARTDRTVGR